MNVNLLKFSLGPPLPRTLEPMSPQKNPEKPPTNVTTERAMYGGDSDEDGEEELDGPAAEREIVQAVFRRLSANSVSMRVHDVIIKGNSKTHDALIEAEVTDLLRSVGTVQDLLRAAILANARLRHLDVFDSVYITLDASSPELPGTTNVFIEVVGAASPITGSVCCFSELEARSWLLEGSLKLSKIMVTRRITQTEESVWLQ